MFKKLTMTLITIFTVLMMSFSIVACSKVEFEINFMVDNETYAVITTSGDEIIRMPENPVKEDYTFDGWFWDKDVWEKPFTANSLLDAPLSSDMSVYAKFNLNHTHAYTSVVTDPTCTERGYTTYTCECGDTYVDNYVDELGHLFTDYKYNNDAKCGIDGTETAICDHDCGESDTRTKTGSALAHEYGAWISNNDGTHTRTCSHNDSHKETKNCNGGTATCTEKAVCKDCGVAYGGTLEHTYDQTVVLEKYLALPADCINAAQYYYSCTCGEKGTKTFADGEALGHSFTNYEFNNDADCEIDGTETAICDHGCGEDDTRTKEGTALEHTYETTIVPPTCTEEGYTAQICHCGDIIDKESIVPATGHDYKDEVTAPTCTEQGYTTHTCTVCGDAYVDDYVDAIGHAYQEKISNNDGTKTVTCECGYSIVSVDETILIVKDNVVTRLTTYGKTLSSIVIPDSVTSIGDYAFKDCSSLTSIVIGDSVTSIGSYAFYSCDSLTSVVIGDSVTSIGARAFAYCDSLTSVVIGDSVTSIGEDAFCECDSLTSIEIPDSVTSIDSGAFAGCSSLTSVVIGDGVTSIGDYAFYKCSSLTSIVIPDSVTSIGYGAFV